MIPLFGYIGSCLCTYVLHACGDRYTSLRHQKSTSLPITKILVTWSFLWPGSMHESTPPAVTYINQERCLALLVDKFPDLLALTS